MDDITDIDIESVAVEPDHCHRCGAGVGTRRFEGRELHWCQSCDLLLSRCPIPGVHVVVHDDTDVLLLDEPIPQHEGLWSLPGGHATPEEGPKAAGVRELGEETGLVADPADLRFLTIHHAEFPEVALYLITYAVNRANVDGELAPEAEGFEVGYRSLETIRSSPDQIRDSDVERIEMALDA